MIYLDCDYERFLEKDRYHQGTENHYIMWFGF